MAPACPPKITRQQAGAEGAEGLEWKMGTSVPGWGLSEALSSVPSSPPSRSTSHPILEMCTNLQIFVLRVHMARTQKSGGGREES